MMLKWTIVLLLILVPISPACFGGADCGNRNSTEKNSGSESDENSEENNDEKISVDPSKIVQDVATIASQNSNAQKTGPTTKGKTKRVSAIRRSQKNSEEAPELSSESDIDNASAAGSNTAEKSLSSPDTSQFRSPPWASLTAAPDSTCPFIKTGENKYFQYDPKFLAFTLEEALLNFPNTLRPVHDKSPSKSLPYTGTLAPIIGCGSQACKRCAKFVLERMKRHLFSEVMDSAVRNESLKEITDLSTKWGISSPIMSQQCPVLYDTVDRPQRSPYRFTSRDTRTLQRLMAKNDEKTNREVEVRGNVAILPSETETDSFDDEDFAHRAQRQRRWSDSEEFQQILSMECIGRGRKSKDTGLMCLCSICWSYGVLKSNFQPKYVNLMQCDKDRRCLSGYGDCKERVRSITVLQNVGTSTRPVYSEYNINIPFCCDCQVAANSIIKKLIKG